MILYYSTYLGYDLTFKSSQCFLRDKRKQEIGTAHKYCLSTKSKVFKDTIHG